MEQVVLVDESDNEIGLMDKLEAHRGRGTLHRAISVLLYRRKNGTIEVLLQKRSAFKPLWPLFWSNTCCSHPRPGETYFGCVVRKLKQELGIFLNKNILKLLFTFVYQARYSPDLSEYEHDAVIVGEWNGEVMLNSQEVSQYQWENWLKLQTQLKNSSQKFTPWAPLLVNNQKMQSFMKNL